MGKLKSRRIGWRIKANMATLLEGITRHWFCFFLSKGWWSYSFCPTSRPLSSAQWSRKWKNSPIVQLLTVVSISRLLYCEEEEGRRKWIKTVMTRHRQGKTEPMTCNALWKSCHIRVTGHIRTGLVNRPIVGRLQFFENLGSFSVGWDRSQEVIKNFLSHFHNVKNLWKSC